MRMSLILWPIKDVIYAVVGSAIFYMNLIWPVTTFLPQTLQRIFIIYSEGVRYWEWNAQKKRVRGCEMGEGRSCAKRKFKIFRIALSKYDGLRTGFKWTTFDRGEWWEMLKSESKAWFQCVKNSFLKHEISFFFSWILLNSLFANSFQNFCFECFLLAHLLLLYFISDSDIGKALNLRKMVH